MVNTIITILVFLLGLVFGSFFNVVGLRLPKKMPFANERSFCPSCKQQLSWYELIPIISFVLQQGKCRKCKKGISFMYPSIELLTGLLFAYSYTTIGIKFELITALLLVSMLMIVLVSDISYMIIPNKVLLFFLPFLIIMCFVQPLDPWWSSIIGGLVVFLIVAFIIIVSKGGMGAGDMKLFGVLGITLGIEKVLLTFFLACLTGAVVGMLLLSFKIIDRKQPFPFGPYIIVATIISYFHGDFFITWYFRFLQ